MPGSAFLDLSDAVVAALVAAPAVLRADRVRRGRNLPMPAAWTSAIDVRTISSSGSIDNIAGTTLRWKTLIGVEITARAEAGTDGEAAIDALLLAVFGRLADAAVSMPSGVISVALSPAVKWDVDEADTTVVRAGLTLRVDHYTTNALASMA